MSPRAKPTARRMALLVCLCAGLGCNGPETFTDLDELEAYVTGDGSPHVRTITRNGIKVSARYMPTEVMMIPSYRRYLEALERPGKGHSPTQGQRVASPIDARGKLVERRRVYDRSVFFLLSIGHEDPAKDIVYDRMKRGSEAYTQWLQKLLFGLQEHVSLESASMGKVPLNTYHMERTFGMGKSRSFCLMFPAQVGGQSVLAPDAKWLELHLKEFGLGAGTLTLRFELPLQDVRYRLPPTRRPSLS